MTSLYGQYARLIGSIAAKVQRQTKTHLDWKELISYGWVGLLEAHARFDASQGFLFTTYAHYRIAGAIRDGIREMGFLNSEEESDEATEEEDATPLADALLSEESERWRARRSLNSLPAELRTLLKGYYFADESLETAGKYLGWSRSWASRQHRQALELLRGSTHEM